MYDFANSVLAIAFVFYFSQWLVVEKGVPDLAYNALLAGGSAVLLLIAPALGARADRTGRRQAYVNRSTVLLFVFYLATSLAVLFMPGRPWLAAACFLVANCCYQLSLVFYNALLPLLTQRDRVARLSGSGQAGNWLGQIAGLALSLPFAMGAVYIAGEPGRAQALLPAVLVSMALAMPFLLLFKPAGERAVGAPLPLAQQWRAQWPQMLRLLRKPGIGAFLLAYFLFMDALLTVAANYAIFLQNVFAVPDAQKLALIGGVLVSATLFALAAGRVADRIGLKRLLVILLTAWSVLMLVQAAAPNFAVFAAVQVLVGGSFGAVWTVTRALMTRLCPDDEITFGFSLYALAERTAALVGPLTWGAITWLLADLGPLRYRIALAVMAGYGIIGLLVLLRVPSDPPRPG